MANYPSSQNTDDNLYLAVNNLATVLDGDITAGDTTINVSDASNFPSVGILTIDLEAIHYTGKTATSFTGCTRGFDGTTGAVHLNGATVFHDVPAAHHNVLKDEIKAISDDLRDAFTADLDDAVAAAATATDIKQRLDHIATQIKAIISGSDWKDTPSSTVNQLETDVNAIESELAAIQTDLDDTVTPVASASNLSVRLNHIATQLKNITGETDWKTVPADDLTDKLSLSGGTMSGAIAMGSSKITGLAAATANGDALRYEQLVGVYLPLSGGSISGNIQFSSGSVSNLPIRISDSNNGFWGATNEFSAVVNASNRMAWTNGNTITYAAIEPSNDDSLALGTGSKRWSDVQSVLINGADYGFMNGWILREYPCEASDVHTKTKQWMKDNAYKGIQILNKDGSLVCVVGHNGKVYANGFDSLDNVSEL